MEIASDFIGDASALEPLREPQSESLAIPTLIGLAWIGEDFGNRSGELAISTMIGLALLSGQKFKEGGFEPGAALLQRRQNREKQGFFAESTPQYKLIYRRYDFSRVISHCYSLLPGPFTSLSRDAFDLLAVLGCGLGT
jgi:hypothetical protein